MVRAAARDERADHGLADADRPRLLLDEQVGDHAEVRTRPERLHEHRAVADHDVVDGADDDEGVVARDERAVRIVEGLGPRVAGEPEVAAAHRRELGPGQAGELDDTRDVGRRRLAARLHHVR